MYHHLRYFIVHFLVVPNCLLLIMSYSTKFGTIQCQIVTIQYQSSTLLHHMVKYQNGECIYSSLFMASTLYHHSRYSKVHFLERYQTWYYTEQNWLMSSTMYYHLRYSIVHFLVVPNYLLLIIPYSTKFGTIQYQIDTIQYQSSTLLHHMVKYLND